jgi:hypothetical protein
MGTYSYDRRVAADDKVQKAIRGYLHHVQGVKEEYQPPASLTRHVQTALSQGEAEQRKALQGILSHDKATKPKYRLPSSLIRQVTEALA